MKQNANLQFEEHVSYFGTGDLSVSLHVSLGLVYSQSLGLHKL